jgi:hypothetical protein
MFGSLVCQGNEDILNMVNIIIVYDVEGRPIDVPHKTNTELTITTGHI